MPTWIKFCGTTSLADAEASIAAGADALGFIFAPSKRHVSVDQARQITQRLPAKIEKIGVFMNESVENILSMAAQAGLTGVQLHGNEPAGDLGRIADWRSDHQRRLRVIRTVLVKENFRDDLRSVLRSMPAPDCMLLDAGTGSGKTFAWNDAAEVMRTMDHAATIKLIVAGGLTPENVGQAVEMFSPWGVDVVSGVEKQAGQKDPQKLKAFVDSVRKAEKR